jgi:tetratricopeptide (TPR) repeat protein
MAGYNAQRAFLAAQGPSDNLLAIRGSILLRMKLPWLAIKDFEKMLDIRERENMSEDRIADAHMHLGDAYSCCPLSKKKKEEGLALLLKGVQVLSHSTNSPNLPRARRKLADAYWRLGHVDEYEKTLRQSEEDATRLGAFDQIRDSDKGEMSPTTHTVERESD